MKVAVSTIAFSSNTELVNELKKYFPDSKINSSLKRFNFQELIEFYKDADAIITGLESIDNDLIENLPKLKYVSKYGVGLDNIDITACKEHNIKIGWTGGVNKNAVAEITLGFIINLIRNINLTSNQIKKGLWNKSGGESINSMTIGIIGYGNIGQELVRLLAPFNCRILINEIKDDIISKNKKKLEFVTKEYLYQNSDIISIHTPLTNQTKYMINESAFNLMHKKPYIINTARGGIINENDLKNALDKKLIKGAALDVFEKEPIDDINLIKYENIITTPHISGNSSIAVKEMGMSAISHLIKFKENE